MSFKSIRQLPDEPIVIIEFEGFVSLEDVNASNEASLPLVMAAATDLCLIMDTSSATSNFGEMLKILQYNVHAHSDGEMPFEVQPMFVGTDTMAKFFADAARLKQFGGQIIPIFVTMDDALAAARQWLVHKHAERHQQKAS